MSGVLSDDSAPKHLPVWPACYCVCSADWPFQTQSTFSTRLLRAMYIKIKATQFSAAGDCGIYTHYHQHRLNLRISLGGEGIMMQG
jgi:hypothetical protein